VVGLWQPSRMRLRPEVDVHHVIAELRRLAVEAENLYPYGAGPRREQALLFRDQYLAWADTTERTLRNLLADEDVQAGLYTQRHWHIRNLTSGTARPAELINAEIDTQATRLRRTADALETSVARLTATPGQIVVCDTNVFLHYQRFDQVDWSGIAGTTPVRLVLPLIVIEELDAKKYAGDPGLRRRAQRVLRVLEQLLSSAHDSRVARLGDEVTLEVLDDDGHVRRSNADDEILDRCEYLEQATSSQVLILTGDVGMRVRARGRHLQVRSMPDELRRKLDDVAGETP
jgi:hypothetical protein